MKGSFQFSSKQDGVYITVYPPKDGGEKASIKDALFYIEKRKITGCDIVIMNRAFHETIDQPVTMKVSQDSVYASREFAEYTISSDYMSMEAVFYPPFEGAEMLTEEEIYKDILLQGVRFGINKKEIKRFLSERAYGDIYLVAVGKTPRDGRDGFVEYKFNPQLSSTPKINEDGTVDFRMLDNVNHIRKGDVVAVLHPEDKGDSGLDVLNRMVSSRNVKHVSFRYGRNLSISQDGLNLISEVSGHIMLEADKIFVSNTLELVNIDISTGNIEYDGDVAIKGNILTGFCVKATGNISVNGIVEGATLEAGGNIVITCGIQGVSKAIVRAKGNIIVKFIESAKIVEADGDIETDCILHSHVFAKGSITAAGRKGLIVGGEVRSTCVVYAKNIGNEIGTSTTIGVGVDPSVSARMQQLKVCLEENGKRKIQLIQILTALSKMQEQMGTLPYDKRELQKKAAENLTQIDVELKSQKVEVERLRSMLTDAGNARIQVTNTIYSGTKLMFGDLYQFVKDKRQYCKYIKENADIVCRPL